MAVRAAHDTQVLVIAPIREQFVLLSTQIRLGRNLIPGVVFALRAMLRDNVVAMAEAPIHVGFYVHVTKTSVDNTCVCDAEDGID